MSLDDEPPAKRPKLVGGLDGADDAPSEDRPQQLETESPEQLQADKEFDVGITEFIVPDKIGFTGILKQRYTDFCVNEILPSGKVLHLTNLSPPSRKTGGGQVEKSKDDEESNKAKSKAEDVAVKEEVIFSGRKQEGPKQDDAQPGGEKGGGQDAEESEVNAEISDEHRERIASIFGEDIIKPLLSLYRAVLKHPERRPAEFSSVYSKEIDDRELRTQAHQSIRLAFSSRLDTRTLDDGKIEVSAAPRVVKQRGGGFQRDGIKIKGQQGWKELGGEYLHFTIYKENKDTMEAVAFLAAQLKVAPRNFAFSGTKDRRAVTVQRASVYRLRAETVAAVGKRLRAGTKIGDYEYQPQGLELGDLGGNEFLITLRDCHFPDEGACTTLSERLRLAESILAPAVAAFRDGGFINYYGLQRFGSFTTGTDTVGKKLLQGDLRGAIRDILSYSPTVLNPPPGMTVSSDDRHRAEALDIWVNTHDSHKALDKLPRKFSAERYIIQYLGYVDRRQNRRTREQDWQGALQTIPRNLRLMYVHAYQSLVWNFIAGERWRLHGQKVIPGDLVLVNEHTAKQAPADEPTVDADGEPIIRPAAHDSAPSADDFVRARPLTADEAASGAYSIFDIVLPLPGYDVIYPPNDLEALYVKFMASPRGGGLDPHDMRRSWRDISLSGSYRKLLARPGSDISFEVKAYTEDDEQLVETDLSRLEDAGLVAKPRQKFASENHPPVVVSAEESTETEAGEDGDGDGGEETGDAHMQDVENVDDDTVAKKIAVILKMQLGPSTYATMALRELMGAGNVKVYKPDFGGGR